MAEQKRALVVDDSKSARLVLRRMLEKHELLVDAVESGNRALEFLKFNRPDIIFMDHMMPGMDGFETVKAIKGQPDTAKIPVMMYTSKGGDLYLEQALEIGAVGVLPKTVAPAELFQALHKIGLVEERRREERPTDDENASERAEDIILQRSKPAAVTAFTEPGMPPSANDSSRSDLDEQLRHLLEEQRVEIRKDFLLSMENVARQTATKLHKELDEKLSRLQPAAEVKFTAWQFPVVLLTVLLGLSLVWNYKLTQLKAGAPAAKPAVAPAAGAVADAPDNTIAELQAMQTDTETRLRSSWETAAWAMNQALNYRYDEIALDGERAEIVESLLNRLNDSGYRGKVTLQTHAGEFCLLGSQEKGFRLPPPDLSLDKCEFIGNPVQAADTPSAHQSLRFANFLTSTPLLNNGDIELEITTLPRSQALTTYPPKATATAHSWNQSALANNRILIQLQTR